MSRRGGLSRSCEDEAVRQLAELLRRTMAAVGHDGLAEDDLFDAVQNARVVKDAERYEAAFHGAGLARFLLHWRDRDRVPDGLRDPALERAIEGIYRPDTERASQYFWASLAGQFDAVLHFDATRAVEPLERTARWDAGDLPETYPFAV
jgi:erythromycin esterase-like protein